MCLDGANLLVGGRFYNDRYRETNYAASVNLSTGLQGVWDPHMMGSDVYTICLTGKQGFLLEVVFIQPMLPVEISLLP